MCGVPIYTAEVTEGQESVPYLQFKTVMRPHYFRNGQSHPLLKQWIGCFFVKICTEFCIHIKHEFLFFLLRWEFENKSFVGNDHPPFMYFNPNNMVAYINTSSLTQEQYGLVGGLYRRVIYHYYQIVNVDTIVVLADRKGITCCLKHFSAVLNSFLLNLLVSSRLKRVTCKLVACRIT